MLTRTCKFGESCKFDHPIWVPEGGIPDWKEVTIVIIYMPIKIIFLLYSTFSIGYCKVICILQSIYEYLYIYIMVWRAGLLYTSLTYSISYSII